MNKRQTKKEVFLVLSSFIVGGLMMLLFMTLLIYSKPNNEKQVPIRRTSKVVEKNSIADSLDKIMDATVALQGYREGNQETTGSGFIYKIDEEYGYILTNEHILKNQDAVRVYLPTGEVISAEMLGKDKFLDLAVIRIPKKYVTITAMIGSSDDARVGDSIFAVGTPMGLEYQGSVTTGIISGKDRMVNLSEDDIGSWQMKTMQIDAAINPGSSGGPLCNISGEVIGITTMKLIDTQIEGMGFAIPIEYAINHSKSLENKEAIKWPVIGIEMVNVKDATGLARNEIKAPSIKKGIAVIKVKEDSAASNKLEKGDIIIKVNDKEVDTIAELKYAIYQHQSGDKVEVTFLRDEKEKTTTITLK